MTHPPIAAHTKPQPRLVHWRQCIPACTVCVEGQRLTRQSGGITGVSTSKDCEAAVAQHTPTAVAVKHTHPRQCSPLPAGSTLRAVRGRLQHLGHGMIQLHPVCQDTEGGARANDAPISQAPNRTISDDMPLRAKESRLKAVQCTPQSPSPPCAPGILGGSRRLDHDVHR